MSLAGLRIGLVGPLPPPAGGMANQTRQLKELLESEGATVRLVRVNADYRPRWIGGLRGVRAIFRLFPYLASLWQTAAEVRIFHIMANSGWSWHLYAAPAVWVARLRRVPALVNYRGGEAEAFLSRSARVVLPTLRRATILAVPSGFLKEVFAKFGVSAHVLPNIVDLHRFGQSDRSEATSGRERILIARNLESIYGIDTAIRAFVIVKRQFPNSSLVVAGSGPERTALENLARQLGIDDSVVFTGRLDRDEMAALYRTADVALNPSRVDNMPNSVLEALASGVPVVSTNVGGVPHMVRHRETALLVRPDDPLVMAEAIVEVLGDRMLAGRLRQAGLREVAEYSWPVVRGQLSKLYSVLVAKSESETGLGQSV